VPREVADRARARAGEVGADGCVAVGGGSAIGLGKAIALELDLPVVAIPTTYAGSEMTTIWGLTDRGEKRTGRDERVLPRSVIYDPELTLSLPAAMSVTSGFNAVAHAVEALYAPDATPIISLMAAEGARALLSSLPAVVADGHDLEARSLAQYGAWLCGACLAATTMSLHHKLCHALGGTLDLPHAQTHTVVLPHVLAYNQASAPEALATLSDILGSDDPAAALWSLAGDLGALRSLQELGMAESDVALIAKQVTESPYANPRPVTYDGVEALLRDAWSGAAPATD
jgi:maleylacetate reductase